MSTPEAADPLRAGPAADVVDASARRARLLELLAERGRLQVGEAVDELGVSEATVRRDFTALAAQQLVSRVHGGVVATAVSYELPGRYRTQDRATDRIASAAAALVRPGDVVGFNGGTTTTAVARQVTARADLAAAPLEPALTVVTNAVNIAAEMVIRPWVRTVVLGGVARPHSFELIGPMAQDVLARVWIGTLFLGLNGLSAEGGATCRHEGEAAINAAMVARAERVVAVATADKLGLRAFACICPSTAVHTLVTDSSATAEQLDPLRDAGMDVAVA